MEVATHNWDEKKQEQMLKLFQHLFFLMEVATCSLLSAKNQFIKFQHLFFLMEVATGSS